MRLQPIDAASAADEKSWRGRDDRNFNSLEERKNEDLDMWRLFRNRRELRRFRQLRLKCFKKFVPAFRLRVRILDFQPAANRA
jgi:hypothetical protein